MKKYLSIIIGFCCMIWPVCDVVAQDMSLEAPIENMQETSPQNNTRPLNILDKGTIFDDTLLMEGFTQRYQQESKDTLFAMIQDETLEDIKIAAAVKAFRLKYALTIFSKEKEAAAHLLLRQFNRTDSAFIAVEIMHTLCLMDRYKYFDAFTPQLIQKLDHYNDTINAAAYAAITEIIEKGNNRAREARIIFNTLRKILFLSRRRLAIVKQPDERLSQKLKILRWSIKVLGSQEIKRLPKEMWHLL